MSNQRITIPNQNIDNLKIIMKSIFLQFCNHSTNVTNEISRLNKLVLDDCVPRYIIMHCSIINIYKM